MHEKYVKRFILDIQFSLEIMGPLPDPEIL